MTEADGPGGMTMVLRARLTRVLAAACAATMASALCLVFAGAGSASAADDTLTLSYSCTFPLVGTQTVSVAFGADLPGSATQDVPTGTISTTAVIGLPATVAEGLTLVGATSISGTATASMSVVNGADQIAASTPYIVPTTPVPPSGGFTVDATGSIPSQTFPNTGTAAFTVGDLSLTLTPLTSSGQPTSLGTFTADCSVVSGQNTTLATIPVLAPDSLTVAASADPQTVSAAGQNIGYSYLVTNTGGGTLTGIAITQQTFSGTGTAPTATCPVTTLISGASTTCTASYTTSQADIDAGSITDTVTATGSPITGSPFTSASSTATVTSTATASLTVAASADPQTVSAAGQNIGYSYLVKNTGGVTLNSITVNQQTFTGTGTAPAATCPVATLAPGASTTCTASYTTSQADIDAGSITDTVTATGSPTTGSPFTSASSTATVTTPLPTILHVLPGSGPRFGGNLVLITGSHLIPAAGCAPRRPACGDIVRFGGHRALVLEATSSWVLVVAPPGTGTVNVTVTVGEVATATSEADRYTYRRAL